MEAVPNPNALLDYIIKTKADGIDFDLKKIVELIAIPEVNINAQDAAGKTALHYLAAGGGTFEYVRLLIANGADTTIVDSNNQTAFDTLSNNQPQLMFLFLADFFTKNLPKKDQISAPQKLIFECHLDQQNPYQKIFLKLGRSCFDFTILNWEETQILQAIKSQNTHKSLGLSIPQELDLDQKIGFADQKLIGVFQGFLESFGGIIEGHYQQFIRQEEACVADELAKDNKTTSPIASFLRHSNAGIITEIPDDIIYEIESKLGDQLITSRLAIKSVIPATSPMPAISIPLQQEGQEQAM